MKTNSIKIRPANMNDIGQIAKVHSASAFSAYDETVMNPEIVKGFWSEDVLSEDWKNYIKQSQEDQSLVAFVAEENGVIISVLRTNDAGEHEKKFFEDVNFPKTAINNFIHFKTIYTDPGHQRKGIGKMFIRHIANDAVARGKKGLMTVTTENYAASPNFFKKFGAVWMGTSSVDMKEHYDTTSSQSEVSGLNVNVWFMNPKIILSICDKIDKKDRKDTIKFYKSRYQKQTAVHKKRLSLKTIKLMKSAKTR